MSETDKLIADAYRAVYGGEPVQGDYLFGRKVLELVRGQQAEPTDLKALAIQCGGLALRDDKCIAMDIDDLAKFAAALAGQQSERPAQQTDKLPDKFYEIFGAGVVPTSFAHRMWLAGYYTAKAEK